MEWGAEGPPGVPRGLEAQSYRAWLKEHLQWPLCCPLHAPSILTIPVLEEDLDVWILTPLRPLCKPQASVRKPANDSRPLAPVRHVGHAQPPPGRQPSALSWNFSMSFRARPEGSRMRAPLP